MSANRITDAIAHLDEARRLLVLEAYRTTNFHNYEKLDHFTIAEELDRIDLALGPRGKSMFAPIAEAIRAAYVEIRAARNALTGETI